MFINEFILYSALLGAIVYGAVWFFTKNEGASWGAAIVIGLLAILFAFGDPKSAKTLGDVASNLTLLIMKAIWLVALGAGAYVASLITKTIQP
ncbi:hypothetical protein ACMXYQ_11740 [Neptuniibacter sp. PT34_22]|uniref:hypothetical protein n=1 Tax=Neptuniibacter sp. PT34_22 TaxID=3398205 RepID=UPI0039F5592D